MYEDTFVFVDHSSGEFEGNKYDNIILSDGVVSTKFKNGTGKDLLAFEYGQKVKVSFDIVFGRNVKLEVKSIKAA